MRTIKIMERNSRLLLEKKAFRIPFLLEYGIVTMEIYKDERRRLYA